MINTELNCKDILRYFHSFGTSKNTSYRNVTKIEDKSIFRKSTKIEPKFQEDYTAAPSKIFIKGLYDVKRLLVLSIPRLI